MSNKIKIDYQESTERYRIDPRDKRLKRVARTAIRVATSKAAKHAAIVTASAALVYGGVEAATPDKPEFDGDKIVQIDKLGEKNGTLREAVVNGVDNIEGYVDETMEYVEEDPRNADVLKDEDGVIVDEGDKVYMPEERVENK